MARSLVVHGHFYQPPREDPWSGRVPREPSAAPWHDWNRRVHDECYRAVVGARVLDAEGRIARVVNTLEWLSWDAGPTLLAWLAEEEPATYRAFLDADRRSVERTGHGNALACPYHHVILPLASHRDKVTEVRWGIGDFRRRFGREPEGMWLPEAAVDTETLEVLAGEGIGFTVLGPDQVSAVPNDGRPARVELPSGRSIAIFVYDGPLSHDVAFGTLVEDAEAWVARMTDADDPREVVTLATDGETFGHHHPFGEMALGAMVSSVSARSDARLVNFGAVLARRPPRESVELVEPSAWSCAHGVGRWKENCGCRIDTGRPPRQGWRKVLRRALEELAGDLHRHFEEDGRRLLDDPWAARDAYGSFLGADPATRRERVARHGARPLEAGDLERALTLLEMERDVLRMFTSCGWFFDDLEGLEPLQVLRYAAHALDTFAELGGEARTLEERLRRRLAGAESADGEIGEGRRLWDEVIRAGRGGRAPASSPAPAVDPTGKGRSAPPPPCPEGAKERGSEADASAGPEDAVADRLAQAVRRLLRNPGPDAADAVLRLADRADEVGAALPFEAGTELGAALGREGVEAPVRRVAERLGFAPDEYRDGALPGAPVRFVFGVHLHQPVGNFDRVFRSHADEVYLPFLRRAAERELLPLVLHVSGPLLEWLEADGHRLLDRIGRLAADGAVELLLSGFYEPVLPVLDREDRLAQVGRMRRWLGERFGVDGRGLWLTERVWEPGLAADLAKAGVEYAFVDDRHFLAAGFERGELHRPWTTGADGDTLSLLAIDERLRYLVPFRPPGDISAYLRGLSGARQPLAVLVDDGEKFGGWPGTAEWVWKDGWLERFLDEMEGLRDEGVVRLTAPAEAVARVPSAGLAYLPTASYREMEGWSLPPAAAHRRERLEELVEDDEPEVGARVRGGHWRNFLARYPESNRMHRKARALSALCRERGDPPGARRAIGRAQCNDAYWHGIFGGLYLRHLRAAVWANLAEAEAELRAGEGLAVEVLDFHAEGVDDLWIHGSSFSAVVRPARGGAVTELTPFALGGNLADVLTRRREAYHRWAGRAEDGKEGHEEGSTQETRDGGMPSIHDREGALAFQEMPPFDRERRALLVDRMLPGALAEEAYARVDYDPLLSWSGAAMEWDVDVEDDRIVVRMRKDPPGALEKVLVFRAGGQLRATWRWDPAEFPSEAHFAPELSLAHDVGLTWRPDPRGIWRYPIRTISRAESGRETTVQGESVTPLWPCRQGRATLELRPGSGLHA